MSMNLIEVNPKLLIPNEWNSNKVDPKAFEKLKQSLVRHGAFKPVLCREVEDGVLQVLGGYHRTKAAIELGWESIPVLNLGEVSDTKAREIGLIDNVRYGEDDQELLDKILDELTDLDGFNAVMPEIDIDALLEEEFDLEEEMEDEKPEPKEELFKTLKFKLDIDKAEEIEAILSKVAYDHDYSYSDGYANFADALYHILVLDKR